MIVLGSNETFANQDITAQVVLTFDSTPSQPSRQRIWFEVFFTNHENPDSQRTITFLTQNTGGTIDYGRDFREVVNGDDTNPHQVVIGPYIVPSSTVIKLKIESDNASDTDVSADVRMLIDDEHYRSTGRAAETSPLADSLEERTKSVDDRITDARMGALTDWIDDGRLDALLDLIKAKTDSLTFDGSNVLADVMAMAENVFDADVLADNTIDAGALTTDAINAISTTPEEIDTELTASHGAGNWNEAGGATVNILPLAGDPSASGRLVPLTITAYQHTTINATLSITDNDGDPVDLSAKDLALCAWHKDTPATTVIEMLARGTAQS